MIESSIDRLSVFGSIGSCGLNGGGSPGKDEPNTERPPGDWQGPVENPEPELIPLRDPEIDVPPDESDDDDTDGEIVV